jgi:hypothetical protein
MTNSPVDSSAWERLFKTARGLLAQRGPNVTLSEIGRHAGIGCGTDGSAIVVESLLEQPLGDVLEGLRSLADPALAPIDRGGWSDAVARSCRLSSTGRFCRCGWSLGCSPSAHAHCSVGWPRRERAGERSSTPLGAGGLRSCCGRASRRRPRPPASGTQAAGRFAGRGSGGTDCRLTPRVRKLTRPDLAACAPGWHSRHSPPDEIREPMPFDQPNDQFELRRAPRHGRIRLARRCARG